VHTETLDGEKLKFRLHPNQDALLLPPFTMKQIQYFDNAVLIVYASSVFDEADYIEPDEFYRLRQ
jgi:hypothetical protein